MLRFVSWVGALEGFGLLAGAAPAGQNGPASARKLKGAFVTAFAGPRATTQSCAPGRVDCTLEDSEPCIVHRGGCVMGGSLPIGDLPASVMEVSVFDVRVERGMLHTFRAGVLLPAGRRGP